VWRREIEYIKIGRSIRFKPATADKLIEAGTVPPLEPDKAATSHARRRIVVLSGALNGKTETHVLGSQPPDETTPS
jgi:hypothetical protein